MKWLARRLTFACTLAALHAQSEPKFEVASIHLHTGTDGGGLSAQHGTFTSIRTNLEFLILGAYDLQEFQVSGGPAWMTTDWYDVVAKTERDVGGKELMQMLRPLLAERFKLAFHRETREQPVYELVVAKGGLKIQKSPHDAAYTMSYGAGAVSTMSAKSMPVPVLVHFLSGAAHHPVVDKTGLEGNFDVKLQWTESNLASDIPTIFTALPEQLGLRLEARKGAVEMLIIDHAERPTEN
jgi:uncharacterized protein (TIGR03435 family)